MPKKIKKPNNLQKAKIWPPKAEHQNFATPLNNGEQRVFDLLEDSLCHPQWNIFVKPKLLNKEPDFLIFARHCQDGETCIGDGHHVGARHKGVTIIEVKDWAPGKYRAHNGYIEVHDKHKWQRAKEDPIRRAHEYRRLLANHFIRYSKLDSLRALKETRGCVILPQMPQREAELLLRGGTGLEEKNQRWIQICGKECFEGQSREHVKELIYGGRTHSRGYGDHGRAIDRLWRRLAEPESISDQRRPLELSQQARMRINTPVKTRRVRGAAGSGKTTMLAAHAARLAAEGKECLILTFNITLAHYIQDLVKREARELVRSEKAKHPDRSCHRVDIIHFHQFLKDHGMVYPAGKEFDDEGTDRQIQEWMNKGGSPRPMKKYDAIFVDEGQDFKHLWWDMLRKLCQKKPKESIEQGGSHMTLAVDKAQDIYERETWVDEAHMKGCGFSGPWTELEGCYRLPADMIPIARAYAKIYLKLDDSLLPEHPKEAQTLPMFGTQRTWINLGPEANMHRIVQEAAQQIKTLEEEKPPGDICFLTPSHEIGEAIEANLGEEGILSETIFAPADKEEQRNLKNAFWAGTNVIKGCTVHSFKGWEARHLVIIHQNQGEDDKRISNNMEAMQLYIAITRVKGIPDHRSSSITVINTVPEEEDFKATFERYISPAEVPEPLQQQITQPTSVLDHALAKELFAQIMNMSEATWQKILDVIAKTAGWVYGKDGAALAEMKKETFFRKTRAYLARLDPAGKISLLTVLVAIASAVVTGGVLAPVMATALATAQGRAYVNYLATPEQGYIYVMHAAMPDGEVDIKGGQTTRTPEIRAAELSTQRDGEYEVIAKKWVSDIDRAEDELLELFREHLGDPDVGREQWDLDVDIDPVPFMEDMEGGPVQTATANPSADPSADAPSDTAD
ncbi:MAG: AAA family ATPase [Deltaproteobacteria bacterium]|nr:AAA family ATPase [Deltaproteobacteria bacterium]